MQDEVKMAVESIADTLGRIFSEGIKKAYEERRAMGLPDWRTDGIVPHPYTNESIEAIIAGLVPKSDDSILAVCGSSFQAFAIAEHAGLVDALDISPKQLDYALEKKAFLEHGFFEEFSSYSMPGIIMEDCPRYHQKYFQDMERLKRIQAKCGRINLNVGSILDLPEEGKFSKVYLSNVIGYQGQSTEGYVEFLAKLAERLRKPGYIYAIAADNQYRVMHSGKHNTWGMPIGGYETKWFITALPDSLKTNVELTRKAQRLEHKWLPVVLEPRS